MSSTESLPRPLVLAAVQPPWPSEGRGPDLVVETALELTRRALDRGARLICLPEYLNTASLAPDQAGEWASRAQYLADMLGELAASRGAWIAVSLLVQEQDGRANATFIFGPDGLVGRYDKVHLTRTERELWRLRPGSDYPVFDLPFARVGVMTCYDICFPEVARILALRGANLILFPALQRSYSERELELQVKARAYDNFVWILRSSYGTPRDEPWRPGVPVGKTCIAAPDGTLAADLGRFVGVALAEANPSAQLVGPISHGGPVEPLREARLADRRPDTYGLLTAPPDQLA